MSIFSNKTRLLPMATYVNLNPMNASGLFPYAGAVWEPMTFVKWTQPVYTTANHSSVNNYTLELRYRSADPGADILVASLDTRNAVAGVQLTIVVTSFLVPTINLLGLNGYCFMQTIKNGTAANTYVVDPAIEILP